MQFPTCYSMLEGGAVSFQGFFGDSLSWIAKAITYVILFAAGWAYGVYAIHFYWFFRLYAVWAAEVCGIVLVVHSHPDEESCVTDKIVLEASLGYGHRLKPIFAHKMWMFAGDVERIVHVHIGH